MLVERLCWGTSINDVSRFLTIFDPPSPPDVRFFWVISDPSSPPLKSDIINGRSLWQSLPPDFLTYKNLYKNPFLDFSAKYIAVSLAISGIHSFLKSNRIEL